jgi:hypothetical protein
MTFAHLAAVQADRLAVIWDVSVRENSAALHERSSSVDGLDQAAVPEDGHRVADGVEGDAVVAGEVAFG